MRRWGRGAWAPLGMTLALAMGLAGCGGSESPLGVGPSDAGVDATSTGPVPDGVYTLDNVCETTAPKVCELRKACCEKSSGFDEATCLRRAKADCEQNVAEVKAGQATFNGARIDACLNSLKPIVDKCFWVVDDFTEAARAFKNCRIFAGQVGEGAACTRDDQCKLNDTADAFVSCNASKCKTTHILPAGAACEIKDDLDALCAAGLYCDVTPAGPAPWIGVCKTALSLGAPCQRVRTLECGLGNYCDEVTKKCVAGGPGGATCENDLQCATVSCLKVGDGGLPADGGTGGTCKAQKPAVKPAECGK